MDNKIYDVVILGGGPAGLAAGLYAGRSRLSVLILEKGIDGGQIAVTHDIENYPGQSKVDGMTGQELVAPMTEQCKKFGCERVSDTITACDFSGPVKKFVGSKGEYLGKTVIVCTGAMTRSIGCKNEAKYVGRASATAPSATPTSSRTSRSTWWAAMASPLRSPCIWQAMPERSL